MGPVKLLLCLLMLMASTVEVFAQGGGVTITWQQGVPWSGSTRVGGTIRFTNPSASPVTFSARDVQTTISTGTSGFPAAISVQFTGSPVYPASTSLSPGGFVEVPLMWVINTSHTSSASFTFDFTAYWYANSAGKSQVVSIPVTLDGRTTAVTAGVSGGLLATVPVAPPAPGGKITVVADSAAAGEATLKIGTTESPRTLTVGNNIVHLTDNPSDLGNGTVVKILKGAFEMGSGTIAKDSYGNYDLVINAAGPAGVGDINVTHSQEVDGVVTVWIGNEQVDSYTVFGSDMTYNYHVEPYTQYPDGTYVTLKQTANGDEMVLGTGRIVYGTGPGGIGWVVNITAQGQEDLQPEMNELVARLDLTVFDAENLSISVKIGDQIFPVDVLASGDPYNGVRKVAVFRTDNSLGEFENQKIEWIVSGRVDGELVHEKVVASSMVPSGRIITTDPITYDHAALVDSSATVGRQRNLVPPPNDFDPQDPEADADQTKNYQSVRKAMEDALNGSGVQTPGLPSTSGGTNTGNSVSNSLKGLGTLSGIGQIIPTPAAGSFTGTNALTVTLPVVGPLTWDPADYEPAPNILRLIALVGLLWQYWKVSTRMIKEMLV